MKAHRAIEHREVYTSLENPLETFMNADFSSIPGDTATFADFLLKAHGYGYDGPANTQNNNGCPLVSEFTVDFEEEEEKDLKLGDHSLGERVSRQVLSGFSIQEILNKDLLTRLEDEKTEQDPLTRTQTSFQCSVRSSINFEVSASLNSLIKSLSQSQASSRASIGSQKENTPPLLKNQIKAHLIDHKDDYPSNPLQSITLKCELGVNGIDSQTLRTADFAEIPLTLSIENGLPKNPLSSLDLVIIIKVKAWSSRSALKPAVLLCLEYLFSTLGNSDRVALILLERRPAAKGNILVQKLARLTSNMRKLAMQFLAFGDFSNENASIAQGIEKAFCELSCRTKPADLSQILIVCDEGGVEGEEAEETVKRIRERSRMIDSVFSVNGVYCGNNPKEECFLGRICEETQGFFARSSKISGFKRCLLEVFRKTREVTLFEVQLSLRVQEKAGILHELISPNESALLTRPTQSCYEIRIPKLSFCEKRRVFLLMIIDNSRVLKAEKITVFSVHMMANRFVNPLGREILNFEKLITNRMDVFLYPNIQRDLLRRNPKIYRVFYHSKFLEFVKEWIENNPKVLHSGKMKERGFFKELSENEEISGLRRILETNGMHNFAGFLDGKIIKDFFKSQGAETSLLAGSLLRSLRGLLETEPRSKDTTRVLSKLSRKPCFSNK